ncbi:hypothetical protein HA41_15675 [Pantoea conspicua]|uniref:Uncharacterized protein n=1 Tax=Pantoea conspicua TaxID=472705 RepID=A0A1X1BSY0_9GAMM|nr:hypothetical protein HA41_15675 [Pantoea conspicua]
MIQRRFKPAVDRQANRNVRQGEVAPGDIATGLFQLLIEDAHGMRPPFAGRRQQTRVLMGWRVTHQ